MVDSETCFDLETYTKLKEEILKGGIIYAPRRSGKTLALMEILFTNDNAVILTPSAAHKKIYMDRINRMSTQASSNISLEILKSAKERIKYLGEFTEGGRQTPYLKYFADEMAPQDIPAHIGRDLFAYVLSPRMPIRIIMPKQELTDKILADEMLSLVKHEFCIWNN